MRGKQKKTSGRCEFIFFSLQTLELSYLGERWHKMGVLDFSFVLFSDKKEKRKNLSFFFPFLELGVQYLLLSFSSTEEAHCSFSLPRNPFSRRSSLSTNMRRQDGIGLCFSSQWQKKTPRFAKFKQTSSAFTKTPQKAKIFPSIDSAQKANK